MDKYVDTVKRDTLIKTKRGITLIALVVTIVILLILIGISIAALVGQHGIIEKANWAKFLTEYNSVKESKELYEYQKEQNIITTGNTKYPVTEEKVAIDNVEETLLKTIKIIENIENITEEKVELYKVDMGLINLDIKNEYVINIKTGELYKLNGVKYNGNTYHRPDYGVTKNGEPIEEEPEDTEDTIYLKIGQTKNLTSKLTGNIEWATTDDSVVTVDQTGKITGIAKGEAEIIVSYQTEDLEDTDDISDEETTGTEEETQENNTQIWKVIVERGISDSFSLSLEDKTINEFEVDTLEAKINGKKVATNYLEWKSSDENIVKIDSKGKIKGLKEGVVTITCTWKNDNTKFETCTVTVKENDTLVLDKNIINILQNQTIKISAKYFKEDVTNNATWESENTDIATVEKGKVYGKNIGNTYINVTYEGITVQCEVIVKDTIEEIYTIEDLSLFAKQVNEGKDFTNKTVVIMNDLDFKNEESYISTESKEYADYYVATASWTPIGTSTSAYFKGTLEGNGSKITNLSINTAKPNQGLFGYSKGGTFKNLKLENINIVSTSYRVGGLLGYGASVTISNCKCSGNINATGKNKNNQNFTGGIVGEITTAGGNITNCTNEVNIVGQYYYNGGIVGWMMKGNVTNCINRGQIQGTHIDLGGICGQIGYHVSKTSVMIDKCENYGIIQGTTTNSRNIGGIVGFDSYGGTIKNCINYMSGTISGEGYSNTSTYYGSVGGIAGCLSSKGVHIIQNCKNYATISCNYRGLGGIVGLCKKGTIENCINEGEVLNTGTVYSGSGGIAGWLGINTDTEKCKGIINNCINKGKIESQRSVAGGIAGQLLYGSQVTDSSNYANVITTGKDSNNNTLAGGIVGNISTGNSIVENCNNYGNIEAQYYMCGGIAGRQHTGIIKNCINEGNVTSVRKYIGGITGYTGRYDDSIKCKGTIENCYNKGNISITGTGANSCGAGGITGELVYGSSVITSGNSGNITVNGYNSSSDKTSKVGGISGIMPGYGANSITYCYNIGNVTGSYGQIGGIAGNSTSSTNNIKYCYSTGIITGPAKIGGIIGIKNAGTVTESYYLEDSVKPSSGTATEIRNICK